jgi:hypothetical protein
MIAQFFKKEISYIIKSPNTHCTTTLLFKMADDMSVGETRAVVEERCLAGHLLDDCQRLTNGKELPTPRACAENFMGMYKLCLGKELEEVYGPIRSHLRHRGFEADDDDDEITNMITEVYNNTKLPEIMFLSS